VGPARPSPSPPRVVTSISGYHNLRHPTSAYTTYCIWELAIMPPYLPYWSEPKWFIGDSYFLLSSKEMKGLQEPKLGEPATSKSHYAIMESIMQRLRTHDVASNNGVRNIQKKTTPRPPPLSTIEGVCTDLASKATLGKRTEETMRAEARSPPSTGPAEPAQSTSTQPTLIGSPISMRRRMLSLLSPP
jgi:hypothetical protein